MRLVVAISILFAASGTQAETIDRIAASAGGQVVTESAILLDLRVSAFLDRAPLDLSATAKRKSAERLIDLLLILREARDSHLMLPNTEDAGTLLATVKRDYGGDAGFEAGLAQYGITEKDVAAQLRNGLTAYRFADLRFQVPEVSEEDVRAVYDQLNFATPFEANRDKIKADIAAERASKALDDWLVTARDLARVEFREKVFQ